MKHTKEQYAIFFTELKHNISRIAKDTNNYELYFKMLCADIQRFTSGEYFAPYIPVDFCENETSQ